MVLGQSGWVRRLRSMSTVTGSVDIPVGVTVTAVPSTEPASTVSAVTPPSSIPLATVTGISTVNGAPASTFART